MRTPLLRAIAVAIALLALAPSVASAQATRTWVSGVGDDVNPCSRTAPCKTFAGAISKTATAGQIDVLDPGGFGAVTITKAMTLNGSGVRGGITHSMSNGIVVNAPADADVVVRNLDLLGAGNGLIAIRVLGARNVLLQNLRLEGTTTGGVVVATTGTTNVVLDDVTISDVRGPTTPAAVDVVPGVAPASASVLLRDVVITGSDVAVRAGPRGTVRLVQSAIFGNVLGVTTVEDGLVTADAESVVAGNTTDATPDAAYTHASRRPPPETITVPGPAPAPTTVTVEKQVPAPTPAPTRCIVPRLTGLTLAAARTRLADAGCRAGTVRRRATRKRRSVGRVVAQSRGAGRFLPAGAKVAVTVGRRAA